MNHVDVFISRKSADAKYAKPIYEYLIAEGLAVFESDHTLKELGNADYIKAIDEALASTTHMIVVGSSSENIKSSWVEAEWLFFLNRKRSAKTSGNLFTVITKDFNIADLPPSLANYEAIPFNRKNFPIIYNYVREKNTPPKPAPKNPFPAEVQNKYLWIMLAVLLISMLSVFIYLKYQPKDITIFAKPDKSLSLDSNYPVFSGGDISIVIGNKEERKQLLSNGEINLKQIPSNYIGKKVPVTLFAKYWKGQTDSIVLGKSITLKVIPDGSLGKISGKVIDYDGNPISGVSISVDNDTIVDNEVDGTFTISLPFRLQKEYYRMEYSKSGFETYKTTYFPVSGHTDVPLPRLKQ
ncbi:TIR domain-containing protein [Neptunitalea lumnitzerae]|uniref:TIR domain-containing protein n=1 Tax=Neptunitalea lumnitzerae TaxID=2965509 RepID=A0ABQ5MJG6_9FLAO|nr:TIR domain-containing protein [Neptunitalea sp. Y10]GLB49451.1 hypothetical protein Y10_18190 [Neptunitalea sp. Y10]